MILLIKKLFIGVEREFGQEILVLGGNGILDGFRDALDRLGEGVEGAGFLHALDRLAQRVEGGIQTRR